MNSSLKIFELSKPSDDDRIPIGTFGYFRARNRHRVYELVLDEFLKSNLTQAQLARRLGKPPEVVCRLLGAAGNWTLNTVSDLLFAINGGEANYTILYPLDASPQNFTTEDWLNSPVATGSSAQFLVLEATSPDDNGAKTQNEN